MTFPTGALPTNREFGASVYAARNKASLTLTELADIAGVSKQTVVRIEKGSITSLAAWRKVAEVLRIPLDSSATITVPLPSIEERISRLPPWARDFIAQLQSEAKASAKTLQQLTMTPQHRPGEVTHGSNGREAAIPDSDVVRFYFNGISYIEVRHQGNKLLIHHNTAQLGITLISSNTFETSEA